MHPTRKHIVYRWLTGVGLVLAAGAYVMFYGFGNQFPEISREPREEVEDVAIPSDEEKAVVMAAVTLMERLEDHQASFSPATPDPSLVLSRETGSLADNTMPDLSLIFLSPRGNAAIIDNQPYETGSFLPDGRRVESITKQGVVLERDGDRELLPWIDPGQVSLRNEPSKDSSVANQSAEQDTATINTDRSEQSQ